MKRAKTALTSGTLVQMVGKVGSLNECGKYCFSFIGTDKLRYSDILTKLKPNETLKHGSYKGAGKQAMGTQMHSPQTRCRPNSYKQS